MKELTKKRLEDAGWTEDRKIHVKAIEDLYIKNGFEIINCVIEFIEEFGMLQLRVPSGDNSFDFVNFNPTHTLGNGIDYKYYKAINAYYSDVDGVKNNNFYPVGETDSGNMILVMGSNGHFFSYTDGCLVKYGNSVEEMLDCLIGGYGLPLIYD